MVGIPPKPEASGTHLVDKRTQRPADVPCWTAEDSFWLVKFSVEIPQEQLIDLLQVMLLYLGTTVTIDEYLVPSSDRTNVANAQLSLRIFGLVCTHTLIRQIIGQAELQEAMIRRTRQDNPTF